MRYCKLTTQQPIPRIACLVVIPPGFWGIPNIMANQKTHWKMYRFFPSPNKWENTFGTQMWPSKLPELEVYTLEKTYINDYLWDIFQPRWIKANPNVTWPLNPPGSPLVPAFGLEKLHDGTEEVVDDKAINALVTLVRQRQHILQMESYHWSPQEFKLGYSNDNSVVSLHLGSNCFRSWKSTNTL